MIKGLHKKPAQVRNRIAIGITATGGACLLLLWGFVLLPMQIRAGDNNVGASVERQAFDFIQEKSKVSEDSVSVAKEIEKDNVAPDLFNKRLRYHPTPTAVTAAKPPANEDSSVAGTTDTVEGANVFEQDAGDGETASNLPVQITE